MKPAIIVLATCLMLGGVAYGDEVKEGEASPSISSQASNNGTDGAPLRKSFERDKKFSLTSEQQGKIREAVFKYKENKIHLEEAVKLARLNFEKVATDPGSDIKAAKSAAQEVADSVSKLTAAKYAIKNQISFQILTAEQRKARVFMGGSWRHGRGGHPGHESVAEQASQQDDGLGSGPLVSLEEVSEDLNDDLM